MNTVLGCLGIVVLVLLQSVTLAFALWYFRKRGWIAHDDWKHLFAAVAVHCGAGADRGLYWPGPVPDDHGQDADGVLLGDGE